MLYDLSYIKFARHQNPKIGQTNGTALQPTVGRVFANVRPGRMSIDPHADVVKYAVYDQVQDFRNYLMLLTWGLGWLRVVIMAVASGILLASPGQLHAQDAAHGC